MGNFSNILKKILLLLIFITLWFPIIQNKLSIFELEPLKGDISLPNEPNFNELSWLNSEFQKEQENYLNNMFGFRNTCVRLNNQIAFSLFNKAHAKDVIIGKETYLFDEKYLLAYNGSDYIGKDSINNTLKKLKFVSDTLNKLNKQIIIVFAAGKASFFPEYIPDKYLPASDFTNYKIYSNEIKNLNVRYIDFNNWALLNKNKSKYPLYPQHGIHWTTYASAYASDSIIKSIEHYRDIDMANYKLSDFKFDDPKNLDYDMADGMNLLFKFKGFKVAYPNIQIEDTIGKAKPNILMISDSYYWEMYVSGIIKSFGDNHFWYYNKQVYPETYKKELMTTELKIDQEIKKHDVIIIMATEFNCKYLGWGAIERLYTYFNKNSDDIFINSQRNNKIKLLIDDIRKNKQWLKDTKSRANEKNITLDSALVLEAMWQLKN